MITEAAPGGAAASLRVRQLPVVVIPSAPARRLSALRQQVARDLVDQRLAAREAADLVAGKLEGATRRGR